LEALKEELERLPNGEQVLWSPELVPGATLPPSDIVEAVRAFCRQRGIQLSIDGAGATYR
jgi:threonine aldolase